MALPVRLERRTMPDPLDIIRDDFNVLGRFFGGRLFANGGDNPLSELANFGVDIRQDFGDSSRSCLAS